MAEAANSLDLSHEMLPTEAGQVDPEEDLRVPFTFWLDYLNSLESLQCADVQIRVGQKTFQAHRLILASHSPFLKRILIDHHRDESETQIQILLPDVDSNDFVCMMNFMYRGDCHNPEALRRVQEVLMLERALADESEPNLVEPEQSLSEIEIPARSKRKRIRNRNLEAYEMVSISITDRSERTRTVISEADGDDDDEDANSSHNDSAEEPEVEKGDGKRSRPSRLRPKKTAKEDLECCDTKFDDEVHYVTHKESVHLEKVSDSRFLICCGEKIMGTFDVHLKQSHHLDEENKVAICCDVTFQDLGELTKHCENRHGLKVSEYRQVNCCATKLVSLQEYKEHKAQDNHVECSECAFISTDVRHLDFHKFNRHGQGTESEVKKALSCKFCQRAFKHVHQRLEHEDKHDDSYKYNCQSCGKKFKLMSSLKSHVYRMGKNHNPGNKQYSCDSCDKIFSSIVSKRKHHRVEHQGKDAHSCIKCDLIFVDKHRLDNHTKIVHLKVKDIQCTFCGKLFATQERMRIHEKFVHVVESKAVPCDVCDKSFPNRERMVDHRRSVHRARKYQCDSCGSTFKNSSTLKSHVVSIHLEHQKKPLKCSVCGKGFLHDSRLRAHEIIHTDESPFNCQYCGRPNKCKNNNLKHEKRCKKAPKDEDEGLETVSTSPAQSSHAFSVEVQPQSVIPDMGGDLDGDVKRDVNGDVDGDAHPIMLPDLAISSGITIPCDFITTAIAKDVLTADMDD